MRGLFVELALKMGSAEPTTFAEALEHSRLQRRHLLLGNGFSIGVHRAFGYDSLYEDAVARDPSLARLFRPGDTNFETALEQCEAADELRLREGLIRAVAAVHPEHSLRITVTVHSIRGSDRSAGGPSGIKCIVTVIIARSTIFAATNMLAHLPD